MEIWDKLKRPPKSALKQIKGGRLKGMTDVNPQWRYQVMTEFFGVCGYHWKYEIVRLWLEPITDGQVCAFAQINLYVKGSEWSEPIPGIGGSMLVAKETAGLHVSDEAYKMAVTDALSVAMKMLGMAADIYAGLWDGSKYGDAPAKYEPDTSPVKIPKKDSNRQMSSKQWNFAKKIGEELGMKESEIVEMIKWKAGKESIEPRSWKMAKLILPKENFEEILVEYSEYQREKDSEPDDIPY